MVSNMLTIDKYLLGQIRLNNISTKKIYYRC